jgi:hypothetical protein
MSNVSIFEGEDGDWHVAVGKGHYAQGHPKLRAMEIAAEIARETGVTEIQIYDRNRKLLENVPIPHGN